MLPLQNVILGCVLVSVQYWSGALAANPDKLCRELCRAQSGTDPRDAEILGCRCHPDKDSDKEDNTVLVDPEQRDAEERSRRSAEDQDLQQYGSSIFRWGKRADDDDAVEIPDHLEVDPEGNGHAILDLAKRFPDSADPDLDLGQGYKRVFRWGKRSGEPEHGVNVFRWGKRQGGWEGHDDQYPGTHSVFRWGKRAQDGSDAAAALDLDDNKRGGSSSVFRWGKKRMAPGAQVWSDNDDMRASDLLRQIRDMYVSKRLGSHDIEQRQRTSSVFRWGK